jgi:hypothetical protein
MSQENVDRALELLDAFNRRDLDAFVALADDGIEVESRLVAMEGGYHGHEGLRTWWGDFLGAFPDYNLELEELRDLGDVTLGHMRGWGHGAGSATPLVDPFWIPMRWRNGKSSGGATARPRLRPSKPWGCGSSRCRGRTWRPFDASPRASRSCPATRP